MSIGLPKSNLIWFLSLFPSFHLLTMQFICLIWLKLPTQMLPWENLPVLRKMEVYRMPSVGSISALIKGNIHRQEKMGKDNGTFPSIDPLDAFYLLNPSGDLKCSQLDFEEWFRDQKLEVFHL